MLLGIKGLAIKFSTNYMHKMLSHNDKIDWFMVEENMTFFTVLIALCCLQLKLSFLLPWFKSEVAKLTYGYPTLKLYVVATIALIVELLLIMLVQVLFAAHVGELNVLPLSTQISFYLSFGSAMLITFLSCVEITLVYKAYRDLSRHFGNNHITEKLLTQHSGQW